MPDNEIIDRMNRNIIPAITKLHNIASRLTREQDPKSMDIIQAISIIETEMEIAKTDSKG
jgi:hypothetical protein